MKFVEEDLYRRKFGIYGIRNKINGKIYIGQTRNYFLKRFWKHNWELENGSHYNACLQNEWNEFGRDAFEFIIVKEVDDSKLLNDLEIYYIDYYKNLEKSYNILPGGSSNGYVPISESRKKIIGEKNRTHMLGRHHTEETKAKMSKIRTGMRVERSTDILTPDIVAKAKKRLIDGMEMSDVAKELGVDYKLINNLVSNNTWKSVKVDGWDEFIKNRKTYKRLTKEDHKEICRLYTEQGYTKNQLAEMYGRTPEMIRKILKKSYDNPVP